MGKYLLQTDNQRTIAEIVLKHRSEQGVNKQAVAEEMKSMGKNAPESTVRQVIKALEQNNWQLPPLGMAAPPTLRGAVAQVAGGEIATITQPKPAAIQISFGQQKIDLDPMVFTKSYLLYLDMQTRLGLTDSFSTVVYDAISFMWRLLTTRPQVQDNQVELLVTTHPRAPQEESDTLEPVNAS